MHKIKDFKEKIINCLKDLERHTTLLNKAGRFDLNKDAEEFYRDLLNLFFGWNLKNLNTEKNPNHEGADLGCIEKGIAVQITSENDSEKVHNSIKGFKNESLKKGYKELYILMFQGKGDFPRANFAETVDDAFTFNKSKHIIDHSDLIARLKDAEFEYVKNIFDYLDKFVGLSYSGLDEDIDDLGIIADIFEYIQENIPSKAGDTSEITASESFAKLRVKVSLNFPKEQRARLSEMVLNTSTKRNLVANYLENIDEETKLLDLKEILQKNYCHLQNTSNHEAPLNDIMIIEELSLQLLPRNKLSNPHYQANAKAIVLHFFEFCYIGEKTEDEKRNQTQPSFD